MRYFNKAHLYLQLLNKLLKRSASRNFLLFQEFLYFASLRSGVWFITLSIIITLMKRPMLTLDTRRDFIRKNFAYT